MNKSRVWGAKTGRLPRVFAKHPAIFVGDTTLLRFRCLIGMPVWFLSLAAVLGIWTLAAAPKAAESRSIRPENLTEIDVEMLMNLEVTTVSRTPQKVSQAAAAIAVITQEDLRRSGATTIAEALRMRMISSSRGISSRRSPVGTTT